MSIKKKSKSIKLPIPKEKKHVPLNSLLLDDENPRFGGLLKNKSQQEIIEKLAKEKNLLELIESFNQNGYYEAEPLLVIENKKEPGKFTVIEGNRRVAALKVLFDKDLLKKFGFTNSNLIPKGIIASQLKEKIPVQVYGSKDDLWSYLGFRHIKGAMEWDPYSKALYIASLFDNGTKIEEIVEKIGDQNSLIVKMSNGSRVIRQAEKEGFIMPQSLQRFSFSHFYIILGYKEVQKFLGLKITSSTVLKEKPITRNKLENLKTLVELIYGDISGSTKSIIRSQNPDIRRLAAIIGDPVAINELRDNLGQPDILETIYKTTKAATSEAKEITPNLIAESLSKLKKALGNISNYKKFDINTRINIEEIKKVADTILSFDKTDAQKKKTTK